jgi:hypothetical protein
LSEREEVRKKRKRGEKKERKERKRKRRKEGEEEEDEIKIGKFQGNILYGIFSMKLKIKLELLAFKYLNCYLERLIVVNVFILVILGVSC